MSEPRTAGPFYVAGGTLRPGTPSYVARRADADLYEHLLAGDFCYVLTARQMGKSSLMASTAKRLEGEGVQTAIVDLTQIGTERGAAEATQWYFGVAHEIHRRLGIAEPLRPWWQERADLPALQRLTGFFREMVLPHCPGKVVIFVDEIDSTIGLPFADDFFAAIRACFNARATDSAFERLTFVLLGVASPDQLIQDAARTPFNIGQRIDLTDFTLNEAHPLAACLSSDTEVAARRLERVLYWTSGHPYLTQALCRAVGEKSTDAGSPEAIVDPLVESLFLSSRAQREETNLKHARARLTPRGAERRRLLRLYLRIRRGEKVPDEPTSPLFAQLKLSGVVKVQDDGNLAVRNRIYEAVLTPQWAKSEMPADRGYQLAAALLAAVVIGLLLYYEVFYPRIYVRQMQAATDSDAYEVAAQAADKLKSIPFWRSRASELMARFWEHRALHEASLGHRDESLLSWLKAIEAKDTPRRRKEAQALVGDDYVELQATFHSPDPIAALAFSPDGRYVLGASPKGELRAWNGEAGRSLKRVRSFRQLSELPPSAVQLSGDGRTLLTLAEQGRLETLDLDTDRLVSSISIDAALGGFIYFRKFSQDGRYLLVSYMDHSISVWDLKAGRRFELSREVAVAGAFAADGKMVATAGKKGVQVWNLESHQLLRPPWRQEGIIEILEFSPDGRLILTSDDQGAVRLWDWRTGEPTGRLLSPVESLTALAFSSDGQMFLTGGNNAIRMWRNRENPPKGLGLHKGIPRAVGFHGSGILLAGEDGAVEVDRMGSSEPVRPLWRLTTDSRIFFSPDAQTILEVTGRAYRLRIAETGALACPANQQAEPILSAAAFSPDGRLVAIVGQSVVHLWDTKTCLFTSFPLISADYDAVSEASFSLDAQWLLVLRDSRLSVLETRSGRSFPLSLDTSGIVLLAQFSPDGKTLLIGDSDGAQLWSRASGKPLTPHLKLGLIETAAFRPDGRGFFVATARWLYSFSLEGKTAHLHSARLLRGTWKGVYRFVPRCDDCLEVVLGYSDSFFVETIHFDEPDNPPIQGTPKELLAKWQKVLGLQFDKKMNFFFQY